MQRSCSMRSLVRVCQHGRVAMFCVGVGGGVRGDCMLSALSPQHDPQHGPQHGPDGAYCTTALVQPSGAPPARGGRAVGLTRGSSG